MIDTQNYKYNRASRIELVLRPMEGKHPKDSTGLVDTRLFKGENKLFAFYDPQTNLWNSRYMLGITPEPLKQRFTTYNSLITHVKSYLKRRNIEITEELDKETA